MFDTLQDIFDSLGRGSRALFIFFAILLFVSSTALLYMLKQSLVVEVPAHGGSLSEGIIGSPRFINPVLAVGIRYGEGGGYKTRGAYNALAKAAAVRRHLDP